MQNHTNGSNQFYNQPGGGDHQRQIRRKQRSRAIWRNLRRYWFWVVLAAVGLWAWSDPANLNLLLNTLGSALRLLFGMMFIIVQFGALFWFMSQSKTEIIKPGDHKTMTFADYKGQDKLVEMVRQWMSLLYDRTEFQEMGGRFINGLLLYGPPGTGKTMLAKCMAGEAGVAFISMEGSGFRGMFLGMDVLKMITFIRKARKLAREYGACIAFIDEIDAVGTARGGVMGGKGGGGGGLFGGGTGALTRLLYEMDGVDEKSRAERWADWWAQLRGKEPPPRDWHVLFMGTTNRPDVLDPALTRPGRFDRAIEVGLPDSAGRRSIVEYYLSTVKHDASIDVEAIVQDTGRTTPAKIAAAITKDAVRIALFSGRRAIGQKDIDQAFEELDFGLEQPVEELPEDQRRKTAIHEAGHAVAIYHYLPEHRIVRSTIVGRAGGINGFIQHIPRFEERGVPLRRYVARIMVALAGHFAVKIFEGEYWTGATSDFAQVRANIRALANFGQFGPPIFNPYTLDLDKPGAWMADAEERNKYASFWNKCEMAIERFLLDHQAEVLALADALLERESLSGNETVEVIEEAIANPMHTIDAWNKRWNNPDTLEMVDDAEAYLLPVSSNETVNSDE